MYAGLTQNSISKTNVLLNKFNNILPSKWATYTIIQFLFQIICRNYNSISDDNILARRKKQIKDIKRLVKYLFFITNQINYFTD